MGDILIPLGIPAIATFAIWQLMHRVFKARRSMRILTALLLPIVVILSLYTLGQWGEFSNDDIPVVVIVIVCDFIIGGGVVFLLERGQFKLKS